MASYRLFFKTALSIFHFFYKPSVFILSPNNLIFYRCELNSSEPLVCAARRRSAPRSAPSRIHAKTHLGTHWLKPRFYSEGAGTIWALTPKIKYGCFMISDPQTVGPRPPFSSQQQTRPWFTAKMDPNPDHGGHSYRGNERAGQKPPSLTTETEAGFRKAHTPSAGRRETSRHTRLLRAWAAETRGVGAKQALHGRGVSPRIMTVQSALIFTEMKF
jgi:hypothetical protein